MHAGKALILVVVGVVVLALGVFTFIPSTRPGFVKQLFRQASGFTPAKTPTEALDKFREAIKIRDYETAAEYCTKDYREQVLKVASGAKKLGEAIDSLLYNMEKNGVVNNKTRFTLRLLEPFPKTFKVVDIKESSKGAIAQLAEDDPLPKLDQPLPQGFLSGHELMIGSLLPDATGVFNQVTLVKDETGHWKIDMPVTPRLRLSVDKLRDSATNYANAIYQVRDEVRNNPVTKEGVQSELERRLNESK
jgi:hypothetical protein